MLNKFSKIILFYFAYLPLFVILAISNIFQMKYLLVTLSGLILFGFIFIWLLLKTIKSVTSSQEKVSINENKNSEYLGFLITYIIPFLVSFTGIRSIISFCILFFLIAYLYIDTSLFGVNPLLKIFFGYNIYQVSLGKTTYFLLSKNKHLQGEKNLDIKKLGGNVLIEYGA
ncbi:MAG: hypothetical protein Q7S27_04595 [Nanoarchaeota archaeon]|nr:hypothetical protein [Nanoarchaeota archaeon]